MPDGEIASAQSSISNTMRDALKATAFRLMGNYELPDLTRTQVLSYEALILRSRVLRAALERSDADIKAMAKISANLVATASLASS